MLKSRKPPEEAKLNRIKLPLESSIRPLSGIKDLLAQAEANRGSQVELAWTADKPDHIFALNVEWDANLADPFWSLYEDNAGTSNKVWDQTFAAADIELLYDVLVMSCGAVAHSNKLSDILKSQPPSTKEDWSKPINSQSGLPAKGLPSSSESAQKLKSDANPQTGTTGDTKSNSENNNQNTNPGPGGVPGSPPPGYAYPPYPPPGGSLPPGAGFPAGAYAPPPGNMPPVAFPMPYPPNMVPGQAFVLTPSIMPPPGWQYGSQTDISNNAPNSPPMQPNTFAQPNIQAANQPLTDRLSTLPMDASLFSKHSEISLINLLREAELITEPVLAAALKVNDLVQDGKLAVGQAIQALKKHCSKGAAIEDYIDESMLSTGKSSPDKTKLAPKTKTMSKEFSAAFDLLQTAGLLSKDDLATAKNVSRKHGGNLVSILEAAQKLDEKTFSAALICIELLNKSLMKTEQCVIALNYCNRSRVGFDEAMEELSWENPRHSKPA